MNYKHLENHFAEMFGCAARIIKSTDKMFLIIGQNRNTKDDQGQWEKDGEPIDFDYVKEQVIASGGTERELIESANEYKRLSELSWEDYFDERMKKVFAQAPKKTIGVGIVNCGRAPIKDLSNTIEFNDEVVILHNVISEFSGKGKKQAEDIVSLLNSLELLAAQKSDTNLALPITPSQKEICVKAIEQQVNVKGFQGRFAKALLTLQEKFAPAKAEKK